MSLVEINSEDENMFPNNEITHDDEYIEKNSKENDLVVDPLKEGLDRKYQGIPESKPSSTGIHHMLESITVLKKHSSRPLEVGYLN